VLHFTRARERSSATDRRWKLQLQKTENFNIYHHSTLAKPFCQSHLDTDAFAAKNFLVSLVQQTSNCFQYLQMNVETAHRYFVVDKLYVVVVTIYL